MARPMHRHRSIRRAYTAKHKIDTRAANAGAKVARRDRRDARATAALKALPAGASRPAWLDSWLSALLDKPATKITADDLQSVQSVLA